MEVTVTDYIYRYRLRKYNEHVSEMINDKIIYVTDLTLCPLRRKYRIRYPLLSFNMEPGTIIGELVHRGLQSLLEEESTSGEIIWRSEVEVEKEIFVNNEKYIVKGRADLVGYIADGNALKPYYVVEIKSVRKVPELPLEHHAEQLLIYLNLLGAAKGILVYVSFDKIVEYKYTDKDAEAVNINDLVESIISLKYAPRYEWECRYCPYRRLCSLSKA